MPDHTRNSAHVEEGRRAYAAGLSTADAYRSLLSLNAGASRFSDSLHGWFAAEREAQAHALEAQARQATKLEAQASQAPQGAHALTDSPEGPLCSCGWHPHPGMKPASYGRAAKMHVRMAGKRTRAS